MIIARRRWGVKVREGVYRAGVVPRTARTITIMLTYTGGGDGMWERCALSRCVYVSPRTGMLRLRPQNDGWQRRSVRSEIRHLLPQRSLDFARDDGWLTSTQTPWEASPKLATRANSTKYGAANGAVFTIPCTCIYAFRMATCAMLGGIRASLAVSRPVSSGQVSR